MGQITIEAPLGSLVNYKSTYDANNVSCGNIIVQDSRTINTQAANNKIIIKGRLSEAGRSGGVSNMDAKVKDVNDTEYRSETESYDESTGEYSISLHKSNLKKISDILTNENKSEVNIIDEIYEVSGINSDVSDVDVIINNSDNTTSGNAYKGRVPDICARGSHKVNIVFDKYIGNTSIPRANRFPHIDASNIGRLQITDSKIFTPDARYTPFTSVVIKNCIQALNLRQFNYSVFANTDPKERVFNIKRGTGQPIFLNPETSSVYGITGQVTYNDGANYGDIWNFSNLGTGFSSVILDGFHNFINNLVNIPVEYRELGQWIVYAPSKWIETSAEEVAGAVEKGWTITSISGIDLVKTLSNTGGYMDNIDYYTVGSENTVNAYPESGYTFDGLEIYSYLQDRTYTYSGNTFTGSSAWGNISIKPLFSVASAYNITYSSAVGGTISGPATAFLGDSVTVTVTPDSGYVAGNILVDGAASGNPFIMPGHDVTVSTTFYPVYNITYDTVAGGTISGPATRREGLTVSVTVTPDSGYTLEYITVDGEPITGSSFTMPGHDVAVSASFIQGSAYTYTAKRLASGVVAVGDNVGIMFCYNLPTGKAKIMNLTPNASEYNVSMSDISSATRVSTTEYTITTNYEIPMHTIANVSGSVIKIKNEAGRGLGFNPTEDNNTRVTTGSATAGTAISTKGWATASTSAYPSQFLSIDANGDMTIGNLATNKSTWVLTAVTE